MRLWSSAGDLVQSIPHPSTVWALKALPNGDLVAGCADGNGYVWTRDASRAAQPAIAAAFKAEVAAFEVSAEQVKEGMLGDLDTTNLPGSEALSQPGQREGQTKIIKDEGTRMALMSHDCLWMTSDDR